MVAKVVGTNLWTLPTWGLCMSSIPLLGKLQDFFFGFSQVFVKVFLLGSWICGNPGYCFVAYFKHISPLVWNAVVQKAGLCKCVSS